MATLAAASAKAGARLIVALALAGGAQTARADVLQVGAQGQYEWVAGGPVAVATPGSDPVLTDPALVDPATAAAVSADDPTDAQLDALEAALHPASFTDALDAAGPTRWRERVARMAAKYDISPALLEAVVWQESRWNEVARSPAGARGLTQLMPGTARQMGVNADDPLANLEGGARYLRMQLDAFGGNIEKALAAYNAGPARVTRAGGIPAIRETQLYVAAIMARLAEPVRK